MKVEIIVPRALSSIWSIWPGVALGLIFAASATVALADPAALGTANHELVCRAPAGEPIHVSVETTVLSNVPCKRIRMAGSAHTVWGCEGKRNPSNDSVRYDFDINDWPAQLTVTGHSAVLHKDAEFFPCQSAS